MTAPSPARWTLGALAAVALAVPGVARARGSKLPPGGNRCVDSFGTVIDGVCRDSDRCVELAYPVFARGNTMRTGKDRVTADAYNVTVRLNSVRVAPGDWLAGDADGVVAIPAERVGEVLAIAEEIERVEALIRSAVAGGKRLDEARRDLGYHALQTREADA